MLLAIAGLCRTGAGLRLLQADRLILESNEKEFIVGKKFYRVLHAYSRTHLLKIGYRSMLPFYINLLMLYVLALNMLRIIRHCVQGRTSFCKELFVKNTFRPHAFTYFMTET